MNANSEFESYKKTIIDALAISEEYCRKNRLDHNVNLKSGRDIVTQADYDTQAIIVELINSRHKHHGIVSEENFAISGNSEYLWVVDPIDGTVNYNSGLPIYGTSIALMLNDTVLAGGVTFPALGDTYIATKGFGAYKNSSKVSTRKNVAVSDAVGSVILTSHYSESQSDKATELINALNKTCRGVRVFVCEAFELASIAVGALDFNIVHKADLYGAAAGVLLVDEAGGICRTLSGKEFDRESETLVACGDARLHSELLKLVNY